MFRLTTTAADVYAINLQRLPDSVYSASGAALSTAGEGPFELLACLPHWLFQGGKELD